MRRYTPARNAIQQQRERWGLGQDIEGPPAASVHPLPTMPRAAPAGWMRPLPGLPDRPFYDPLLPSGEGAIDYLTRQADAARADITEGSPATPVEVYPNWESRMVGMRDFVAALQGSPDPAYGSPAQLPFGVVFTEYVVPQAYTCFWKTFRLYSNPVPSALIETNTLLTLLVDGLPVPDYIRMPLGPLMTVALNTFLIAGEGRRLGVALELIGDTTGSTPTDLIDDTTIFTCLIYGNLRLRTGAALSSEVGAAAPAPPPPPRQQRAPAAPAVPAFRIEWRAAGGGNNAMLIPMQNDRGQRRDLTRAEVIQYRAFLDAQRLSARDRTMFGVYLRSLGMS